MVTADLMSCNVLREATRGNSRGRGSIGFSPDKMLQGRLFAYGDAQRYQRPTLPGAQLSPRRCHAGGR
jgi:hypothetical protein